MQLLVKRFFSAIGAMISWEKYEGQCKKCDWKVKHLWQIALQWRRDIFYLFILMDWLADLLIMCSGSKSGSEAAQDCRSSSWSRAVCTSQTQTHLPREVAVQERGWQHQPGLLESLPAACHWPWTPGNSVRWWKWDSAGYLWARARFVGYMW